MEEALQKEVVDGFTAIMLRYDKVQKIPWWWVRDDLIKLGLNHCCSTTITVVAEFPLQGLFFPPLKILKQPVKVACKICGEG